jgi:hypothetical protein
VTAGSRWARAALIGCVVVAVVAPGAAKSAAPVRDPHTIACPAPPAGWSNPPGTGKTVESPQIDQNIAALGASDQVEVACDYFALPQKHILVSVNYAVPDDINPQSDFYWGCSSSITPWNPSDRVFRVMSQNQWAIAAFSDIGGYLAQAEVPKFEHITRQLLTNAEGYGHPCSLNTVPTLVTSNFHFSFQVAAGGGSGSFWVALKPRQKTAAHVDRVTGVEIALHVQTRGPTHRLTIKVVRGIDFLPARAHVAGRVRLRVRVVASQVPSCGVGKTGTLTITTAPSVWLAVCGRTFLHGKARTQIQFFY